MKKKQSPLNKMLSVLILLIIIVAIALSCGKKDTSDIMRDNLSKALSQGVMSMSIDEFNLSENDDGTYSILTTVKYAGDYHSTETIEQLSLTPVVRQFFEDNKEVSNLRIIAYGIVDNHVHDFVYERNGASAVLKESTKLQ